MIAKIKQAWIDALRSGKFVQGQKALCDGGAYCCLGVLCAVTNNIPSYTEEDGSFGWDDVLPEAVAAACKLESQDPYVAVADPDDPRLKGVGSVRRHFSLSTLNDAGFTFNEIADLIEAQL